VWKLGFRSRSPCCWKSPIFNAAVFLMGLIGTASLAAHAIAIQIAMLTFMVPLGLAQAVTVRVGLALGRRDPAGISRAGWTSFVLGVGFMACMALLIIAMPHQLVHLFLDESDPANAPVIALAVSFLTIAALFQIADGAQVVGAGMLRGPPRHHHPHGLCGVRLLGDRHGGRSDPRFPLRMGGSGYLDRSRRGSRGRRLAHDHTLDPPGSTGTGALLKRHCCGGVTTPHIRFVDG
jgi:hypothetical protein